MWRHQAYSARFVERAAVNHSVQPAGDFASIFWWIGSQAGIRPAFLSSVMNSSDMVQQLLPLRMQNIGGIHDVRHISAPRESTAGVSLPDSGHQKTWDLPLIKVKFDAVMNIAQNQANRARLIVVSSRHAGDFLNAFPSSAVGTSTPHVCVCGEQISADGTVVAASRDIWGELVFCH